MLGSDMLAYLRNDVLDDAEVPYKWLDAELMRFLNYAEVQACRRAHLLIDWTTAVDYGTSGTATTAGTAGTLGTQGERQLCVLPIVADQATYLLSPKILQVKRVQFKSMTYPINGPVSYAELDDLMSGWWGTNGTVGTAGSGGVPTFFINEPPNTVTFVQGPSAATTAYLVVSRIPLISFTATTQPEIEEKYHEGLMNWAAHLAYMKPNDKTLNLNLAAVYEKRFTQQFGPLPDAYTERMRKTLATRQRFRPREFGS